MPKPESTARIHWNLAIEPRLLKATSQYGIEHDLKPRQVVELALAHLLAIPPAIPNVDIGAVLCPQCERGVICQGKCELCNWHEKPRDWHPKHARATKRPRRKRRRASDVEETTTDA